MAQRTMAEQLDLPLKILAILAVAGFLYWLSTTAEPTEVVLEEGQEEEVEPAAETFIQTIHENPDFFIDNQRLQLSEVTVGTRLGLHAFWAEQEAQPDEEEDAAEAEDEVYEILVRLPRALVDQGVGASEGDQVWITGHIQEVNDSVLTAWDEEGVFESPEDRGLVETEDYFFEADGLHTTPPAAGGDMPQSADSNGDLPAGD